MIVLCRSDVVEAVPWVEDFLIDMAGENEIYRARIRRFAVARLSSKWTTLKGPLSDARDELLLLDSLQIIIDNCNTDQDLEALNELRIVDRIFELALDPSTEDLIRRQALVVIAKLFMFEHPLVDTFESRFRLLPLFREWLPSNDSTKV